ncbi:hypothetical protein CEXT_475911 [Caerostris extrusa]|uniref:Uncharacterized protein n=1 Tax=Caerostris extrusa TaxID=172846 RepID=A0AAV4T3N8_CAEEX|nr:hypothetical protein CEXT_475911 [Caerostris extrusa]
MGTCEAPRCGFWSQCCTECVDPGGVCVGEKPSNRFLNWLHFPGNAGKTYLKQKNKSEVCASLQNHSQNSNRCVMPLTRQPQFKQGMGRVPFCLYGPRRSRPISLSGGNPKRALTAAAEKSEAP